MSVSSVFCKVIHFTLSATTKKVAIKFAIIIHIIKRMTRYRHKNYSNRLPISRQRRNAIGALHTFLRLLRETSGRIAIRPYIMTWKVRQSLAEIADFRRKIL